MTTTVGDVTVRRGRAAWSVVAAGVALLVSSRLVYADPGESLTEVTAILLFGVVGATILSRHPRHPVGLTFLGALRVVATWPEYVTADSHPQPVEGERLPGFAGADRAAPVVHAVTTLRELAHGIYPPLLAAAGLPAALAAQARKAAVPVTVDADGVGRYPQDVDAAVCSCVLEALQNAAMYAYPATTPRGHGTTNMADRLDALDGHLEVRSAPGKGTRVAGRVSAVPVRTEVRA